MNNDLISREALKEAVEELKYIKETDICRNLHISNEALDIAIKALENQTTEGDCISREALKDTAYINKGNFNTVEGIREWIDNAPPVPLLNEQIAWEQGYEAGLAQAVEITEEQAINKLHETGWLIGHDKEMTTRPQGEWIKEDNGKTTDLYRCSICGRSILLCKDADLSKYPFCHCGADMRKGGAE